MPSNASRPTSLSGDSFPAAPHPHGPGGLWGWALDLYSREGVPEACLEVQDRFNVDVNLMLWAAWTGWAHGHVLTRAELDAAQEAVGPWHREVVVPLRTVRRRLKSGPPPAPDAHHTPNFRHGIKAVELQAEHIEQQVLEALPPERRAEAGPAAALGANLALLLTPEAAGIVTPVLCTALSAMAAEPAP